MRIAILLIRSHVQLYVMYMHLKLLCDYKPNFIVLIVKSRKLTGLIKLVQNKKRIHWESNPKCQRDSASPIPQT